MTIRFAIAGAGAIARTYEQVFNGLAGGSITAVVDPQPLAGRAFAERVGCAAFERLDQVLDADVADAVIICSPPVTHPELAQAAMHAGRHVLCEKPLAVARDDAIAMLATASRSDVVFTMAAKFRYVEDVQRARSLVESGVLGEVILFENVFASRVDMRTRWNGDPAISGGGVLIDNGTHSVDVLRSFLGPISDVLAVEGKRVQGLPVEDTVELFVRTIDGVMGNIDLSWSIDKGTDAYISVYGSQGTVQVGWNESRYRQHGSTEWVVFGQGYDKVQCMRAQVQNFIGAIRGDEPLLITADDALASMSVIEAAYASMTRAAWMPVSRDSPSAPGARADVA